MIGADGSRVVFRLSGTAGSGATIRFILYMILNIELVDKYLEPRVYMEKYEGDANKLQSTPADALKDIITFALTISRMEMITGNVSL